MQKNKLSVKNHSYNGYKTLKFHIIELRQSKKNSAYFKLLAVKIISLIRMLYPTRVKQWEEDINAYGQLQKKVWQEGADALALLKIRLQEEGFLDNPSIKQILFDYVEPFECLNNLLSELLNLGYIDLVKAYVEIEDYEEFEYTYSCFNCGYGLGDKSISKTIEDQPQPWICPKCKFDLFQTRRHSYIRRGIKFNFHTQFPFYTFSWSGAKLEDCYNKYDLDNVREPWVAWHYLSILEWSWQDRRDFFKNRKLTFEKIKIRRKNKLSWTRSAHLRSFRSNSRLLGLQYFRAQMRVIQKSDGIITEPDKVSYNFFQRIRFDKYLDVIFNTITNSNTSTSNDSPRLFAINLVIEDDIYLHLNVEWESGVIGIYHLHSFCDPNGENLKKSIPKKFPRHTYKFINSLLDNPGISVSVSLDKGQDVDENLKRAGINPILVELFIIKKSRAEAILRDGRILLANKPEALLKRLQQYIQSLEFIGWRK